MYQDPARARVQTDFPAEELPISDWPPLIQAAWSLTASTYLGSSCRPGPTDIHTCAKPSVHRRLQGHTCCLEGRSGVPALLCLFRLQDKVGYATRCCFRGHH